MMDLHQYRNGWLNIRIWIFENSFKLYMYFSVLLSAFNEISMHGYEFYSMLSRVSAMHFTQYYYVLLGEYLVLSMLHSVKSILLQIMRENRICVCAHKIGLCF